MTMAPDPHAPFSAPRWPAYPEPERHIPLTPETAMVWRCFTKSSEPQRDIWTDLLVAGSLIAVAAAAGVMILLT